MNRTSPQWFLGSRFWTAVFFALGQATAGHAATVPRDPFDGRQTYSGSTMTCLIANDFYAVHFSAMQEGRQHGERTDFVKYCQEVPAVGRTYLTVDLLDRDVRNTPIALRVVEEEYTRDGRSAGEKRTVAEVPAKIYRNGTADTQVDITQPGHYAVIATIGEDAFSEDDRLRIPFSVAVPAPVKASEWYGTIVGGLVFAFFAVMTLIGYRVYRANCPTATPGAPAEADIWSSHPEKRT